MTQDGAERPNCQKCAGVLLPARNSITERVESLHCLSCGDLILRDYPRRRPNLKEADTTAGKGVSRHDTPRASHKKRAA
jgi:RNase P subunit RPR2